MHSRCKGPAGSRQAQLVGCPPCSTWRLDVCLCLCLQVAMESEAARAEAAAALTEARGVNQAMQAQVRACCGGRRACCLPLAG